MAIDREALRSYIERRGSRLFHVTPVENLGPIRERGLIPGNERGTTTRDDFFSPRPGHVYMVRLLDVPVIEVKGEPRVVAIDLTQLDPSLVDPDEDVVQQHLAMMVGVDPPERKMGGDDQVPAQAGALARWADTTPGFDRPEVTVRSLEDHGRISYRGSIPVSAIEVVDLPSEHIVDFTRRIQKLLIGDPPATPHAGVWKTEVARANALGAKVVSAASARLGLDGLVVDLSDYVPSREVEDALRRAALEAIRDDPPRFDDQRLASVAAALAGAAVRFEPTTSVRDNLDCALAVAEHGAAVVTALAELAGGQAANLVAREAIAAAAAVPWDAEVAG